jgi:1-deoxy-D-xylulose-5-phosphate reductoisomerase
MKSIVLLGSTGSIGTNTLRIVERFPRRFRVAGLAAGRNLSLLIRQAKTFRPRVVSVEREADAVKVRRALAGLKIEVLAGSQGAEAVASRADSDIVVSAITGVQGLRPTLAAVRAGKTVALANKESMVVAGPLLRKEAARSGAVFIPVDSEHSGVFQCLAKESRDAVRKVILTASGGPFWRTPLAELKNKTPEEALRHPRWKMGRKVTIDSATLMNKGLELIEARWLFGLDPDELDVLIHPQSVVHALVEMRDGSVLAQLSVTDMRIPILYALSFPERSEAVLPSLDLARVGPLEFHPAEEKRFPLLGLARRALAAGGSWPVVLNAANEVAVRAFLEGRIRFGDIAGLVRRTLDGHSRTDCRAIGDILETDREARARAFEKLKLMQR